ncbi:hypothetical protein DSM19430T_27330 [Desulfovibrio psychrotolerans]|uniref:Lipoprotein n=2 Tax=Desulfovibrio psychrotolerans TaxID=415242 RepID=A0A7J0BWF3_9BACT|nr:hypothetical protein DSM19430T_27330 [Desulfovibrio psychrotolerans]
MITLSPRMLCLVAILILGTVGCAKNSTTVGPEPDRHIVMSKSFSWLKDLRSELVTEQNGAMSVVLHGTSSSLEKRELFIRTEWFKANGLPAKSLTTRWEPIQLLPRMPFVYTRAAPSGDAVEYRILITDTLK